MAKKTRSYSVKKKDLVSYEDITNRIEELKESAGWTDDDNGTAAEKFEAFFDASCMLIGSEGYSADELEEAQEIIENVSEMAPGLTDKDNEELQKYCHRQALYDTIIAPIEGNIQTLMNGEDVTETADDFSNAIHNFGQSVFDDMKEMMGSLELMNQQWNEDDEEINNAINASQSTKDKIQDRLSKVDLEGLKETAIKKAAQYAATGGDVAGTAKKGMGKALAIFTRKKTASEKFDDLFEQAREVVDNFREIKSDMRQTKIAMENVVENKLEPLYKQSQNLKTEQMEIVRKLSYQVESGKEMIRILEEDVLPEIDSAEKGADDIDPMQQEGFKEIRKGHKALVGRVALLAAQKQEAAALTQTLNITAEGFQNLMHDANTYNNVTSVSMQRTMNTLEMSLSQLDLSIQAAKRNDLANGLFENIITVTELGEELQRNTNVSVDPEKVLELRQRMANIDIGRKQRERLAIETSKNDMKLIDASDEYVDAISDNDGSKESASKVDEASHAFESAKDDWKKAKDSKNTPALEQKPAAKKAGNDNQAAKFNKKSETAEKDSTEEKPEQVGKKPSTKFSGRNKAQKPS